MHLLRCIIINKLLAVEKIWSISLMSVRIWVEQIIVLRLSKIKQSSHFIVLSFDQCAIEYVKKYKRNYE